MSMKDAPLYVLPGTAFMDWPLSPLLQNWVQRGEEGTVDMPFKASEASVEAELRSKGLNGPRLSPEEIDSEIVEQAFYVFPGTTITVCALTLKNGYVVTGASASASPENFDAEIGKRVARDNARGKIWQLEGYRLREELSGVIRKPRVKRSSGNSVDPPDGIADDSDDIQAKLGQKAQ